MQTAIADTWQELCGPTEDCTTFILLNLGITLSCMPGVLGQSVMQCGIHWDALLHNILAVGMHVQFCLVDSTSTFYCTETWMSNAYMSLYIMRYVCVLSQRVVSLSLKVNDLS